MLHDLVRGPGKHVVSTALFAFPIEGDLELPTVLEVG